SSPAAASSRRSCRSRSATWAASERTSKSWKIVGGKLLSFMVLRRGLRWPNGCNVIWSLAERQKLPKYMNVKINRRSAGVQAGSRMGQALRKEHAMTAKKGFLRRVFDAVAEGRARQAERYINQYYAETQ